MNSFDECRLSPKSGPSPIDEIISVTGSNRPRADVQRTSFLGITHRPPDDRPVGRRLAAALTAQMHAKWLIRIGQHRTVYPTTCRSLTSISCNSRLGETHGQPHLPRLHQSGRPLALRLQKRNYALHRPISNATSQRFFTVHNSAQPLA